MKKFIVLLIIASTIVFNNKVYAATAGFSTSGGGTVYSGTQFNVSVDVNCSDSYNAVTVNVNFSNLVFVGVSAGGGWTGISGPFLSGNTVIFSGALLGTSAVGGKNVLNLTFRALNYPSTGTINSSGTVALADGAGTPVNGGGNTVTYSVVNPPPPPPPAPSLVMLSSSTHANQDLWYKSTEATINWNKEEGVTGFSYLLDKEPSTNPDNTKDTDETSLTLSELPEGRNYFHIRAQNDVGWGDPSHFAINIDKTPPNPFGIAKVENETDGKYVLYFATNDSLSGVSHFTAKLDNLDLGTVTTGLEVDKSAYIMSLTAFDKAGNTQTGEIIITEPISIPVSVENTDNSSNAVLIIIIGLSLITFTAITLIFFIKFINKNKKKRIKDVLEAAPTV